MLTLLSFAFVIVLAWLSNHVFYLSDARISREWSSWGLSDVNFTTPGSKDSMGHTKHWDDLQGHGLRFFCLSRVPELPMQIDIQRYDSVSPAETDLLCINKFSLQQALECNSCSHLTDSAKYSILYFSFSLFHSVFKFTLVWWGLNRKMCNWIEIFLNSHTGLNSSTCC